MTITISEQAYRELFQEIQESDPSLALLDQKSGNFVGHDIIWRYPSRFGQGFVREISLRDGLDLAIANYQLHDDIISESSDFEHPLEYTFNIADGYQNSANTIPYHLYGSGVAPGECWKQFAKQRSMWVSVHIEPEVFQSFVGNTTEQVPEALQHLIGNPNQKYYVRPGQATQAMQSALQRILHCPYQGFTQRMFLEGKVWELMALLLEQEVETQQSKQTPTCLKPDDIERIHQAKAILLQRLNNPPSLKQLAQQVGLNECTLKRGFRQVFGTTAFSYLHHYRLEQAKQFLASGEMTVAQVAQSIGFARNYFTKAFCQKFGCTPGAYRKRHR
ncbi:helix-turn-helix transcriptional regulator [Gloeocapsopsis crepidinum LEGE 06123]|uniref:Helix-turn-helix transcriptional regulator n=1 Tax=Gloeocapsopsis crepidinum LEGE 06123 TaxID=588587 RepID=A0ABR9UP55_9CHRO|nr:AraC family transcriptional regulator [Gloeocapsopsis crepidinum]MBE9190066.1 helix-turn-helix transcriptional regulator [Gloeocapsopsis crepidinum LEGE 06123]